MQSLNLIIENLRKNKSRNSLQSNWPVIIVSSYKSQAKMRSCTRLKETKAARHLDTRGDPGLDPFAVKDVIGTTGEI